MNRNFFALAACVAAVSLCTTAAVAALPGPAGFSFAKGAKFTVAGYAAGKPTLSGFPVLVRLQANAPVGFSYADLQNSATGADLCFVDMAGNGLPFEIDTWNASGESLVWVRLPTMTNGTEFVMCWGSSSSGKAVCGDNPWSGYAGVWHLGETGAGGTSANSSPYGSALDAENHENTVASVGKIGGARRISDAERQNNHKVGGLVVDGTQECTKFDGTFTIAGWFYHKDQQVRYDHLFYKRNVNKDTTGGIAIEMPDGNDTQFNIAGNGGTTSSVTVPNVRAVWNHFAFVFDNTTCSVYTNGAFASSVSISKATDNDLAWAFGNDSDRNDNTWKGSIDEVRLRGFVPTADWIAADYATQTSASFLTAGAAEAYGELVDLTAGVSVSDISYTNATIGVSVGSLGAGAASASVLVQLAATSDFSSPVWSTTYSVTEAGQRTFPVAGLATNAAYFARALVTNSLHNAVVAGPFAFETLAPGAPMASAAVSGRTSSSLAATVSVTALGAGSDACTARLEASTDGFATVASFAEASLAAPGSVAMEVSGLSPFTSYALRLRVVNAWGLTTLVDLGSATTLPASGLSEIYVDSLGSGNGSSPESALPTIREALDIAGPGFTIWVRGGEDRSYVVSNETDTLRISAELEGLSIRAYGETPGDGGRAAFSVSPSYIDDGNRIHIVSNAATDVTLAGFTCSYGPRSLGVQNKGSVLLIAVAAPRFTIADCEFFCTGIPGYSGSGANGIVAAINVNDNWHVATGMLVERCFFHDTTGYRGDTAPQPLRVATGTTIRECVFSNAWRIAADPGPGKTKFCDFTFVSNVVHSGPMRDASYFSFPHGLFSSGWGGLGGGAEIAYNVFVGTGEPNRGILALARWDGLGGSERFHHNVVCNYGWVWGFNRGDNAPTGKTVAEIFDNVFDLMDGGTIVRDEGFDGETPRVGTPIFHTGSFSRNNAIVASGAFWGGASALAEDYDRSVVSPLDDIAIDEPPDWVCTNDLFHADFYRYRTLRTATPDLGVLAWRGENNEYPLWIGAKPPLYPSATMLILR